jgi:uncharacterized protein (TIGR00252 family)
MRTTTEVGRIAEQLGAAWLEQHGYIVVDCNWRTRFCELDIIARQSDRIHFVEIKYRRSDRWGNGFAYISLDKSARLQRAARAWLQAHGMSAAFYQIDIMSISGYPEPKYVEYLPNAIACG